jgi:hypothetical protein
MKPNGSGYPSSMFLGTDCARDSQSIANLLAVFFSKRIRAGGLNPG